MTEMKGRGNLHIHQSAQQSLPENNDADDVEVRDEVEHSMQSEQDKVGYLKQRGRVEMMDAEERGSGAGDEDADLVDGIVG